MSSLKNYCSTIDTNEIQDRSLKMTIPTYLLGEKFTKKKKTSAKKTPTKKATSKRMNFKNFLNNENEDEDLYNAPTDFEFYNAPSIQNNVMPASPPPPPPPSSSLPKTPTPPLSSSQTSFTWSDRGLNQRLIQLYQEHQPKFSSGRFRKMQVWKIIVRDLYCAIPEDNPRPTVEQCANRWKTMMRTYKR